MKFQLPNDDKSIVLPTDFSIQDLKDVFSLTPSYRESRRATSIGKRIQENDPTSGFKAELAEEHSETVVLQPVPDNIIIPNMTTFDQAVSKLVYSKQLSPKHQSTDHRMEKKKSTTFRVELSDLPIRKKKTILLNRGTGFISPSETTEPDLKREKENIDHQQTKQKPLKRRISNKKPKGVAAKTSSVTEEPEVNSNEHAQVTTVPVTGDLVTSVSPEKQRTGQTENGDSTPTVFESSVVAKYRGHHEFLTTTFKTKNEEYIILKHQEVPTEVRRILSYDEFKQLFSVENLLLKSK